MKLCFLAGANSIHSKRWIKYFADRGYKVYLISLKPESSNDFGKVKLYLIKKIRYTPILASHLLNLLPVLIQMKILIKKIKPDILHAHCVGGYGWLGALSGFHPLIITAWGDDVLIDPKKSKINKILTKFALKKADLITCNGKPLEKEMMRLGVDPKKIKFIYWATDIYQFKPGIKNKKLRRKLEIFDSPMIISLRSFETIYDVETLIRCVPLVLKEIPRAKFVVAGKGSQELRLKKLAKSLGVFSNIKFVGWIPHEKLPEF